MKAIPHNRFAAALFLTLASAASLHAGTWTGATDASWATAGNWTGTPPDNTGTEAVVYDASSTANLTQTLDAAFSVSGITVGSPTGAVTIGNGVGGSLTIGSGGITLSGSQNLTLSNAVTIGASQTWNVASGRTLTLGAALAAGSGQTVTKSNSGTLDFGTNDLTSGTLELTSGSATGFYSNGGFEVSSGATLKLTGGTFTLNNTNGALTLAGAIVLNGGKFEQIGNSSATFTASNVSGSGTFSYYTTSTGGVNRQFNINFTGTASDVINLQNRSTNHANNRIRLTGNNSGFLGTFNINSTSGTQRFVALGSNTAGSASANWNISDANTLQINSGTSGSPILLGNVAVKLDGTLNVMSGSFLKIGSGKTVEIAQTTETTGAANRNLTVAGTVTNDGSLFLGRSAVATFNSGANWTQNGSFQVKSNGGYGAAMTVNTGASFTYTGSSNILLNPGSSSNASLTIAGGTFTTSTGFESTIASGTPGQYNGTITLSSGGTLKLGANVADLTVTPVSPATKVLVAIGTGGGTVDTNGFNTAISQAITGSGNLTKSGNGTLTLSGASTTYSGDALSLSALCWSMAA